MPHRFGKRLKERREMLNYSQDWVAAQADISQGTLSKIESGQRQPRFDTVVKLAKCLKVEVSYFAEPVASSTWLNSNLLAALLFRLRYWWYRKWKK